MNNGTGDMTYTEDFFGIKYKAERGDTLEITADSDAFYLAYWDGVLNLMKKDMYGRTAVFVDDCSFFSQDDTGITIKVMPGTPSYMKELGKLRPVSKYEAKQHQLGRLW